MTYRILFSERFNKAFSKLDHYTQKMILSWIHKHIENTDDPRSTGKALTSNLKGMWRYRIGDYRLLCDIQDEKLIIYALTIGHRKDIYN